MRITLTWKPGIAKTAPFLLGDYHYELSPITGQEAIGVGRRSRSESGMLPVTDNSVPDLVVKRPKQYMVPARWSVVIERLKAHGIRMTPLDKPTSIAVTMYQMDDIKVAGGFEPDRVQHTQIPGYEGHLLVSGKAIPFERVQTFPGRGRL